jgi:cell division protein FtsQ
MPKKAVLETKKNRILRRLSDISGDFFTAMGLLIAAGLLCSLFIYIYSFMVSRPYFQIKEISVRGLKELTEKDVLASAGVRPAQNLLSINTDAIIRRVSENQWVENVYIGKELPNKLVLEVKERTPLALVKQENDFYLMDAEGFVFKKLGKSDEVDLPVITGVDKKGEIKSQLLLSTLNLLKTVSKSGQYPYVGMISEAHVNDVFGISLISNSGLYLKLGTADFEKKLKQLKFVLTDLENRGMKKGFLCIDLSDESKVTVQRKNVPERLELENKGKQYLI